MLRDYQQKAIADIKAGWNAGNRNVLLELPTGAGKTYTFSNIVKDMNVNTCVMAHRHELVGQMSLALGGLGVPHRIVASDKAVSQIVKAHRKQLGRIMYDSTSPFICGSVDTMILRDPREYANINLWVMDEAHHPLRENKWGKVISMFPNALGLGVTATPIRADGKGLGRHADGVFDLLVHGPSGQELIDQGYLCPYEFVMPKVDDLDISSVEVGATGDLKKNQLRTATHNSKKLIGCMVQSYLKWAPGKTALVFCVDIEHAHKTTEAFRAAGLRFELIVGTMDLDQRTSILERLRAKQLDGVVNVDLFGEGFDAPGVDVVVMARSTMSFALYSQQVGRALRPVYAPGYDLSTVEGRKMAIALGPKPKALIIDHVGNLIPHKLPTSRRLFTLNAREKRSKGEKLAVEDKIKACVNPECARPYLAFYVSCPHCGHEPVVSQRSANIDEVDGDLVLLDMEALQALDKEADRIMQPAHAPQGLPQPALISLLRKHTERTTAQLALREAIQMWGGHALVNHKVNIREAQKLFYLRFRVDTLTAQTLNTALAVELTDKINTNILEGV